MKDYAILLSPNSADIREFSAKFIFTLYAIYCERGKLDAEKYVKSLNLISQGMEQYYIELVGMWQYRIGEMFVMDKPINEWYIYRLGHGVFQIQATKTEGRCLIPPDAREFIIAVLHAGHKCRIIGHPDFILIKLLP